MNYLAHIYLSDNNNPLCIGNFIADEIKGKSYQSYPIEIQKGILLHREIDTYTDVHPIVRQSTKRLHKNYGHYSGIIVDIIYDHFLAKNWASYSDIALEEYVEQFYILLHQYQEILPQKIKLLTPHMIEGNWLLSYRTLEGIQRVLEGMNRRTNNTSKMNKAISDLKEHYSNFEDEFVQFFKELMLFIEQKKIEITQQFN